MISEPGEIDEIYKLIPESAKEQIEKRDEGRREEDDDPS